MLNSRLLMFLIITNCLSLLTLCLLYANDQGHNESIHKLQIFAQVPKNEQIFTDNVIWQVLATKKGFVKLLNAYLDTRWNQTVVRILANGPKFTKRHVLIFCQLWYHDKVIVVSAKPIEYIRTKREFKSENLR